VVPLALAAVSPARGEQTAGFTHGRIGEWRAAVRAAGERPLTGTGADSFWAASERYQDTALARFAHDLPLELLVELGLLGLVLSLALYAAGGRALWAARASPAGWLLGPAFAAFLVTDLIDWPWHMAGPGAVWAAALGALVAVGNARPSP
jgi:O-antigen ligase